MKNIPASMKCSQRPSAKGSDTLLEQQVQHMLVAVEHELRSAPAGIDELSLIKKLQGPPWNLIGALAFHDIQALYPVHFLLFHVLYRLRDTLAEAGENLYISPLRIGIEHQDIIGGKGLPGTVDSLRSFYLDVSQYELPEESVQQMMDDFWEGRGGSNPSSPEILQAARVLGFDSVPDNFQTVKQAFRRAVMQAHPDRGGETEAIQSLNEAFAVLKAHFSQILEHI
ncbi:MULTISPECIES: DNA-J related domain-containing protein [Marinobacter]|uniref:DNA-J related domain-containing protein n=1 Tax=Marinobacter xiaoshiensis TaxID=3073652 RepID=A0ABU2HFF9_9GAMM|nr:MULTISPECIES: DNA-J related domain-containing protein [unclassified Marinobacter]MBK1871895.1 molecular chaperone DnaJ [Marinobacter sp. 1-3A]MDS1309779.1 DNA-J related domain-containing protein [Marinobacter sp. F60267]